MKKIFPVRRQKFSFNSLPVNWFDKNEVLTGLWNALSLTFPEGETFFVRSVRPFQLTVKDEVLRQEIRNFIGQEAAHGKEHRVLNKALNDQGFKNIDQLEDEVRILLKAANKHLPANVKLAATCALEHFTAILAEQLILDDSHLKNMDKSIRDLWIWHAVEESEHKHVAFDVYQEVYGDYVVRVATMLLASVILGLVVFNFQFRLLSQIHHQFDIVGWTNTFKYLFTEEKLAIRLLPMYLDYFKKDFHPSDNDTEELLQLREELISKVYGQKQILVS